MKYTLIFFIALLFCSCEKEHQSIITYKVKGVPKGSSYLYCNNIEVTYEENGKTFYATVDTGWVYSFEHKQGTRVYLKLQPTCNNSYAVGLGFVDGGWFYQAESTNSEAGSFEGKP